MPIRRVHQLSHRVPLTRVTYVISPLQNLTKKDVLWVWVESQYKSFEKIQKMLTGAPVIAYYDPSKGLVQENDASEHDLGAALFRDL